MLEVVILAAGAAKRMGKNKLLLPLGGEPLLFRTISIFMPFCESIYVITGYYHDDLKPLLQTIPKVKCIYNPDYEMGMFTSVQCGASHVRSDFFVIPGDMPFVTKETLIALKESYGKLRIPTFNDRKGHPIYIEKELAESIIAAPQSESLRWIKEKYEITYVKVNDEGILYDIDTQKDYEERSKPL